MAVADVINFFQCLDGCVGKKVMENGRLVGCGLN